MAFFMVKYFVIWKLQLNLVKNKHMKMNILARSYSISFFFILTIATNLRGQDQDNPWLISFGVNTVDYSSTNVSGMVSKTGESTQWFDEFFNVRANQNYIKAPTKLSIGRYLNENFNIELSASINKITKMGSFKVPESISYLAFDVNLNYDIHKIIGESTWFNPYAIMGGGANLLDSDKTLTLNAGLGTKLWTFNKVGFKMQTIYKHNFSGSYPHFQHSISLIYKFGGYDEDNDGVYDKDDKCPEVFGLAEFNGCPDSDEDGIQDSEDACPTVFGVMTLNGCPDSDGDGVTDKKDRCPYVKGASKHGGCPDTDGDGIIDLRDACPKRPGPASNKGCPEIDSDDDGIIDKLDKCKFEVGTVENSGCPDIKKDLEAKLTEIAGSILFVSGTDRYYKKYEIQLNQIADLMKKYNNLKFQIQGHTDNVGPENANYKLSLKRVNRILNFLVSKGINQFNLNVVGFGETVPIATNDTAEGRAKNRRVEIRILN